MITLICPIQGKVGSFIKANSKMDCIMEMELSSSVMEKSMKEISMPTRQMVKEFSIVLMARSLSLFGNKEP